MDNTQLTEDLFYQEFCSPLNQKYRDDPEYTEVDKEGNSLFNAQKAFLSELETFTPVANDDGLVIAFEVRGQPGYLLVDGQYSKDMKNFNYLMLRSIKYFEETGDKVKFILYIGFGDAYVKKL